MIGALAAADGREGLLDDPALSLSIGEAKEVELELVSLRWSVYCQLRNLTTGARLFITECNLEGC